MNKDGPSGSPYETLAEHDRSKTKHDTPGENEHTKQPQSKIPAAMLVRRS
jgi:hypothetical protein